MEDTQVDPVAQGWTDVGADPLAQGWTDVGADPLARGWTDVGADPVAQHVGCYVGACLLLHFPANFLLGYLARWQCLRPAPSRETPRRLLALGPVKAIKIFG